MNLYKEKYLKYKKKYLNLKKNYQSGGVRDIFDFDNFYVDENDKYIANLFLNDKISQDTLYNIKVNYQDFYYKYYEYLTGTSCEEIIIPLYVNTTDIKSNCDHTKIIIDTQFKVNYFESAKYYNKTYFDELKNIDNLDDIFKRDISLLKHKITELIKLNITNPNLDLNNLLIFMDKLKSYNEFWFFINYLINNFIEKYKNNYDIEYLENNKKYKLSESFLMTIIKEIKQKNRYKINDDTFLIINDTNLDFIDFILYNLHNININKSDKIIDIIIKIYDNLENKNITNDNIDSIQFFYKKIFELKFELIDDNSNKINGNFSDLLNTINPELSNKLSDKLIMINKKNDIIKNIKSIFKDTEQKFNIIYDEIKKIMSDIESYINLCILKSKILFNIQDIKDINKDNINTHVEQKKNKFIEDIRDTFINNEEINDKIIQISLQFIKHIPEINNEDDKAKSKDVDIKKLIYEIEHHANLIILSKINIDGKQHILCRRIEPHRHSNIYCRNSVRKEIREIFSKIPNFIYVDYYINTHYGIQTNECIDIHKKYITNLFNNLTDFSDCDISQLNNIDGFCSSWCAYIASIILLNKDKSIEVINNYLETFNLPKKSFIDYHIEEYTQLDKSKEKNIIEFKSNFEKFYDNDIFKYSITGFEYNYVKNLKLYTFMLIFYFYIITEYNISINILNNDDKEKIIKFCEKFNYDELKLKILQNIKYKLIFDSKIENNKLIIDNLKKIHNRHYCTDNIFDHEEFCMCTQICKQIPEKFNKCKKSGSTEICLEPLKNKILSIDEKKVLRKYAEFKKLLFNE